MEDGDRVRFVHDLYEFNDVNSANNTTWKMTRRGALLADRNGPSPNNDLRGRYSRKMLVDIHGWCLMGNHYHLLLSERIEGGLSLFLMKLNVGYAKYFNEKYSRHGYLFQGRTKKVLIDADAHFLHILHYIHLNPLDFLKGAEEWRAGAIRNTGAALKHLDAYRWSSFQDYCGHKNFPSMITKDLFAGVFKNYRKTITSYIADMRPLSEDLALE